MRISTRISKCKGKGNNERLAQNSDTPQQTDSKSCGGWMKRNLFRLLVELVALLSFCVSAFAHHGSAAYDMTKTLSLKGVVTSYEFVNPHAEIRVDVTDRSGNTVHWIAETNNPGRLVRRGWGRNTLKPGDVITIE